MEGCKAAVPIAIGYIPIGITFGLLAKAAGIPNYVTVMMSLIIFAGASQFVGINLIALGTGYIEIILTTFILNLRHLLMSAALSQKVATGTPKGILAVLSFGVTDETFSVASFRGEDTLKPEFLAGLNLLAYSTWNLGTWLGFFLAAGLPDAVKSSMGIALYVMFIGLLVPSCRKSKATLAIALLAMAIHYILQYVPALAGFSTGSKIVITTLIAALAGAVIFPEEDNG
jgi:Predicted branched-chain amino acid permease (azaleucine resistance)